jgi:hypothetical protein
MTTDYQTRVEELLEEAEELPYGPSRMALLEEAVHLADAHQDALQGNAVRKKLVETAVFSGYPEKALVAFSWRLAQADREPERFPEKDLLWEYKWIAARLPKFSQITRKQIEDDLDDLTRRSLRCGYGLRALHSLRWKIAVDMHEPALAREYYRKWEKTPRDGNTNCTACEQQERVRFHLFMDKKDKALKLAEPILRGWLRCAEIPHITYAHVLLPLLQRGHIEKAVECHHKGYRLIHHNLNYLAQVGDHLTFLTLTDNLARAIKLFEKHLGWALESKDQHERWRFYLAAQFLMFRVAESGQTMLKLRLPKAAPGYQEDGRYDVSALAAWIEEMCRDLAKCFDARNGNDGFTRRLAANRRLKRWLTPYPLRQPRKTREVD